MIGNRLSWHLASGDTAAVGKGGYEQRIDGSALLEFVNTGETPSSAKETAPTGIPIILSCFSGSVAPPTLGSDAAANVPATFCRNDLRSIFGSCLHHSITRHHNRASFTAELRRKIPYTPGYRSQVLPSESQTPVLFIDTEGCYDVTALVAGIQEPTSGASAM